MVRRVQLLALALVAACGPEAATETTSGTTSDATTGAHATTSDAPTAPTAPTGQPTTSLPTTDVDTTGAGECPTTVARLDKFDQRVALVLERSSSMLRLWDHDRDDLDDDGIADGTADPATPRVTRWSSLRRALDLALPAAVDTFSLGLVLFPDADVGPPPAADACTTTSSPQVEIGTHTAAELLAALPPADASNLGGASPTAAAMSAAIAALGPGGPTTLRAVIYIGDGAPNCDADAAGDARFEALDDTTEILQAASRDGVLVLGLGVDASDEVAPPVVDGEPDGVAPAAFFTDPGFFASSLATREADIAETLGLWLGVNISQSCVLVAQDPEWTIDRVELNGVVVPQIADCASESGWHLPSPGEVELCGDACEALKQPPVTVELFYSTCDP